MRVLRGSMCILGAVALAVTGCDSGGDDASGPNLSQAPPQIGGGVGPDGVEGTTDPAAPGTDPGTVPGTDPGTDPGPCDLGGRVGVPDYPSGCSFQGFTSASQGSEIYPEAPGMNALFYWESYLNIDGGQASGENALLNIIVRPYAPYNGPSGPGTYSLAGSSLGQVGIEVVIATGCTTQGCKTFYLVDEGSVVFTHLEEGVRIAGFLEAAIAHEVILNQDGSGTLVPGGGSWCLDQHPFDAVMNAAPEVPGATEPAQPSCVAGGNGSYLGNNVKNFALANCYGEMVSLHDTCGQSKALWIMATAGWCPACSETLNSLSSQHGGYLTRAALGAATPGLDMLIVLGENNNSLKPTQSFCQAYAEQHNVDPAMMLIDWSDTEQMIPLVDPPGSGLPVQGLATLWDAINPYLKAEGGYVQSGYPWMAVLRGSNMEYIWSDYSGGGSLDGTIGMLLNQ